MPAVNWARPPKNMPKPNTIWLVAASTSEVCVCAGGWVGGVVGGSSCVSTSRTWGACCAGRPTAMHLQSPLLQSPLLGPVSAPRAPPRAHLDALQQRGGEGKAKEAERACRRGRGGGGRAAVVTGAGHPAPPPDRGCRGRQTHPPRTHAVPNARSEGPGSRHAAERSRMAADLAIASPPVRSAARRPPTWVGGVGHGLDAVLLQGSQPRVEHCDSVGRHGALRVCASGGERGRGGRDAGDREATGVCWGADNGGRGEVVGRF